MDVVGELAACYAFLAHARSAITLSVANAMRKPAILIIGYHKIILHDWLLVSSSLPRLTAREVHDSFKLWTEEKSLVHIGLAAQKPRSHQAPTNPSRDDWPMIFSFNIQGIGDRPVHCSWKPFGCPVSELPERLEHQGDQLEGLVGLRLLLH